MFNLNDFISTYVTQRKHSMFVDDIIAHKEELFSAIKYKSILVIGGAGSIGSSFVKAILPYHPQELCIVDTNENALTELTRDLRSSGSFIPPVYLSYPMDYSTVTFRRMFTAHKRSGRNAAERGFDIVANFSAHKHVRTEKDIYSVEALLRNNVINARGLLELLKEFPPEVYFCVSTDKAANPVNIMGASKRIMEDMIFGYSDAFPVKTARFANVAFSNGSLPAGFLERINKLQPLSAPSDVKRYFVSPEESGQICMLAAMTGCNREIFFPKLEKAQMETFDHIAVCLLKEHGYNVKLCDSDEEAIEAAKALRSGSRDYPVHFSVSDTSGEKAFEEFYIDGEQVDMSRFQSLGVITNKTLPDRSRMADLIMEMDDLFESGGTKADVVKLLSAYLPNFCHMETGRSLDGKM